MTLYVETVPYYHSWNKSTSRLQSKINTISLYPNYATQKQPIGQLIDTSITIILHHTT